MKVLSASLTVKTNRQQVYHPITGYTHMIWQSNLQGITEKLSAQPKRVSFFFLSFFLSFVGMWGLKRCSKVCLCFKSFLSLIPSYKSYFYYFYFNKMKNSLNVLDVITWPRQLKELQTCLSQKHSHFKISYIFIRHFPRQREKVLLKSQLFDFTLQNPMFKTLEF